MADRSVSSQERLVVLESAAQARDDALARRLAHDNNVLDIPVTQSQIADMLGLSLVHTNRTIRALDKEGLVQWGQREICVPDMDKASEYADFERSRKGQRPYI